MKNIILIVLVSIALSGCKIVSSGDKVGIIVKCADEGFWWSTKECELIRGGLNDSSGAIGSSFHFTVDKRYLTNDVDAALRSQKQVRVSYHKEWITAPWRSETHDNTFLDAIEIKDKE